VRNKIKIPNGGIPRHNIAIGNSSSWLPRFDSHIKAYMLKIRTMVARHTSIEVKVSFITEILIFTITDYLC
jgi:hypothetical protein